MAFQVSPGINISEIDLTTSTPAVATSTGAIGGVFNWGPIGKIGQVSTQDLLVSSYGKPTNNNYETFFSGSNFLDYGNDLLVSRAAVTTGFSNNASAALSGNTTIVLAGNTSGVTPNLSVYGPGIVEGTTVITVTANASNEIVILSNAATLGNSGTSNTQSLNFFESTYSFNATANSQSFLDRSSAIVKNIEDFDQGTVPTGVEFIAKYPGDFGNSLKVSVCDTVNQFSSSITLKTDYDVETANAGIAITVNSVVANVYTTCTDPEVLTLVLVEVEAVRQKFIVGDYVTVGNTTIGTQNLKIKSIDDAISTGGSTFYYVYFNITFEQPLTLSTNIESNIINRKWEYFNLFDSAPGTSDTVSSLGRDVVDQVDVVIVDENGLFTGVSGTILEVYQNLSRATNAKSADGKAVYLKNAINDYSKYVWVGNDISGSGTNTAQNVVNSTAVVPYTKSFVGGASGTNETNVTIAALANAYDLFADTVSVDVSLIIAGKATGANDIQMGNYIIDNICENRKDCVAFISPPSSAVVGAGVSGSQATNATTFASNLRASSYAVIDSGYKYQYDKYNDVYRYVPLNGDIAGIAARTDSTRDPWWSPAGFNRGQVKNLVKLAWNPNKAERDELYKKGVNPVVTFPGQGTVLYGDKTAIGKSSAFDRINVRRLFIVLEKTIATASNQLLFEFNDDFTRTQFKNLVEPFLRDVQGRRGIYDFKVVCDETNNTAEVIDSNRFVGDIYIKPAKSINYIQLNFVAVRSGVEFNEIVGLA